MCAGALAVLERLQEPEHTRLRTESSAHLEHTLRALSELAGATLRGRGHLWAMVLPDTRAEQLRDRAFERGLLLNAARPHVLRFMPALDVSPALTDEMSSIVRELL
jgi:acetylornithine/N-succinyldiaminopimelate aminotransferase